ncbi:MAG TPA: hypothetical protein VGL77_11360 [Armatimonadota bacterium]|jgi:tetratricopeptide (TPR) repeat protein
MRKRVPKQRAAPEAAANVPVPDRRVMERMMRDIQRLLNEQQFASAEEADAFLHQLLQEHGGKMPTLPADTPQQQAEDLVYQALETHGAPRVQLAQQALEIDPNCAEAYILLAEETAHSLPEARDLFTKAMEAAERTLGDQYFTDPEYAGHFWGLIETRPYMRARAALATILWQLGERDAAIAHDQALLRLNPNDNQGLRYTLLTCLLAVGRLDAARTLYLQYKDEVSGTWAYLHALLVFRETGPSARARKALQKAFEVNHFAVLYLTGVKSLPQTPPPYHGFGDENEGISVVYTTATAWIETPGALEWLAEEFTRALEEFTARQAKTPQSRRKAG